MPSIAKARQEFTDLLGRAHYAKERIPVTRRNTPYAFIISNADMAEFEKLEKRDKELQNFASARGFNDVDELLASLKASPSDRPVPKRPNTAARLNARPTKPAAPG